MILINPFWTTCPINVTGAENAIGTVSGNTQLVPHYGLFDYSWSAWILTQAEVGAAQQIRGIGYFPYGYNTGGYIYENQVLKLGHVVESEWPDASPQVDLSDLTVTDLKIVKSSYSETIINGIINQQVFSSNFCYDGIRNLLIVWENRDGNWDSSYGSHRTIGASAQCAYINQDNTYPTGSGQILTGKKPYTIIYS